MNITPDWILISERPMSNEEVAALPAEDTFHTYSFPLRAGFVMNISLPLDLTKREADRLARAILTLPFDAPTYYHPWP